jgi:hypothetical protein
VFFGSDPATLRLAEPNRERRLLVFLDRLFVLGNAFGIGLSLGPKLTEGEYVLIRQPVRVHGLGGLWQQFAGQQSALRGNNLRVGRLLASTSVSSEVS